MQFKQTVDPGPIPSAEELETALKVLAHFALSLEQQGQEAAQEGDLHHAFDCFDQERKYIELHNQLTSALEAREAVEYNPPDRKCPQCGDVLEGEFLLNFHLWKVHDGPPPEIIPFD